MASQTLDTKTFKNTSTHFQEDSHSTNPSLEMYALLMLILTIVE